MSQKATRHIVVTENTYNALKNRGKMTDSFDNVITNLLEKAGNENE